MNRFPDSLVLIFGMICLALAASWLLTPGSYDFVKDADGNPTRRIESGSYKPFLSESELEKRSGSGAESEAELRERYRVRPDDEIPRLAWHAFLTKIPTGFEKAQDIIFFVFLIGGVIGIMKATGCFDALIGAAIHHVSGSTVLLVGMMVTLFAVGSSTIGMAEEYMPFIPVLVTLCIALRMDALVAVGIVYIGSGIGYGCAALNPFTVMIAQDIADLPLTSGQWFRWILLAVCLVVGIHHVLRYVHRVRKDPENSLVKDVDYSTGYEMPEDTRFTLVRGLVLLLFAGGIGFFVWGVKVHDWYLTELAAIFLGVGLLTAVLARLSPNRVVREFLSGAAELTGAALLIGFARTIEVILVDAGVIHTVVHGIAQSLSGASATLASAGMLVVQSAFNFVIPSGSGQAYVTMPIMAPLADDLGVSRQTAVLAYQFGDGFTNMVVPTNALLMGMLGLARVPYDRWVRFILPFLLKVYVVAIIALAIANAIGY